uniref:SANT domain-containing protein n=2 Tax=Babesia bovis TaxID=5865 RepID=A7ARN1_BABBO|eukprot:XP_001610768.1 hypothetical protein [Babesia bovis T2Bo]
MRPKPPLSRRVQDASFVGNRVYNASPKKSATGASSTRRGDISLNNTKESVRNISFPQENTALSRDRTGKMQLKSNIQQHQDTFRSTVVDSFMVNGDLVSNNHLDQPTRTRTTSQRRPSIVRYELGTEELQSVEQPAISNDTDTQNTDVHTTQIKDVPMKDAEADTIPVYQMDVDAATPAEPPVKIESSPKRKRGRPKGSKSAAPSKRGPATKKVKVERVVVEKIDLAPAIKRIGARTRSNNNLNLNIVNTRHMADEREALKTDESDSVTVEKVDNDANTEAETTSAADRVALTSRSKRKDINIVVVDDDTKDSDYGVTPKRVPKVTNRKDKQKVVVKKTTGGHADVPITKTRGSKRGKENKGSASSMRIEEGTQTEDGEPVLEENTPVYDSVESERLLMFEQYLDMSERMYCGRPFCIRKKSDSEDPAENNVDEAVSDDESFINKLLEEVEHPLSGERRASVNKTNNGAKTGAKNSFEHTDDSMSVDDPLEFYCSKIDFRFKVSFAMLTSNIRQSQVLDLWGPKEIVLFELGIFKYGKEFFEIQRKIPTKSVKEIVDMYYFWKKTNRYRMWKANRLY